MRMATGTAKHRHSRRHPICLLLAELVAAPLRMVAHTRVPVTCAPPPSRSSQTMATMAILPAIAWPCHTPLPGILHYMTGQALTRRFCSHLPVWDAHALKRALTPHRLTYMTQSASCLELRSSTGVERNGMCRQLPSGDHLLQKVRWHASVHLINRDCDMSKRCQLQPASRTQRMLWHHRLPAGGRWFSPAGALAPLGGTTDSPEPLLHWV